jgi:5'-nucleotidase
MKILVVNDDGIMSEGIKALADFLSISHDVTVVAPDGNRSAFSHSLSIYKDIVVKEIKITDKYRTFSMSGTPADCVKFAMHHFEEKFDLVCSGINKGHNLGSDTVYSGTISACLEGNFFGVKGIAFSNYAHKDCDFNANIKTLSNIFDNLISICFTRVCFL